MTWDEKAAREAVRDFHALMDGLEKGHPDCIGRLRAGWRECYMRCGHKRLGRIVLGYSPEEACANNRNNRGSAVMS